MYKMNKSIDGFNIYFLTFYSYTFVKLYLCIIFNLEKNILFFHKIKKCYSKQVFKTPIIYINQIWGFKYLFAITLFLFIHFTKNYNNKKIYLTTNYLLNLNCLHFNNIFNYIIVAFCDKLL